MKKLEEDIHLYHPKLVLEMDETKVPWCPAESYTYAPTATDKICIHGQNDKRASTATITITKSNQFLPMHIIWEGLSLKTIPKHKKVTT